MYQTKQHAQGKLNGVLWFTNFQIRRFKDETESISIKLI